MRRLLAIVGAMIFAVGVVGVTPAAATHCAPNASIASCQNPVTIVVTEGIGNVCAAAGTRCTHNLSDPTWVGKAVFQHYESDGKTPKDGLYWPGVGPGAVGPYRLDVAKTPQNAGTNFCASSVDGLGCYISTSGILTAGNPSNVGAHCGSSEGKGTVIYESNAGAVRTEGTLGWDQSAATILPLRGQVLKTRTNGVWVTHPSSARPSIVGFTSSRGAGSTAGNCGITQPTTGFQTEGMTVTY